MTHPTLSAPVRAFNRLRRHDTTLDADAILGGIDATFDPRVVEGLHALCASLSKGQLHPFGIAYCRSLLRSALHGRAQVDRYLREHPEVLDQPLNRPLIVFGLQRSGTTFLHRLLAEPADTRSLPLWELFNMLPPERGPDLRRLKAEVSFRGYRLVVPNRFDTIHFVRPHLPDEDQYLLRLDLRAPMLWTSMAALDYAEWLLHQDMAPSCTLFRQMLQILQAQTPDRRLILKNPGHALYAADLMAALPEADFVQTHRDPCRTLPSLCKLTFTAQAGFTRGVDPTTVVDMVTRVQATMAERSVALSEHPRLLHLPYADLVADPVGTARGIHEHFDRGWSDGAEAAVRAYVAGHRQHAKGANPYTLEEYGLHEDGVRLRFADYIERFLS